MTLPNPEDNLLAPSARKDDSSIDRKGWKKVTVNVGVEAVEVYIPQSYALVSEAQIDQVAIDLQNRYNFHIESLKAQAEKNLNDFHHMAEVAARQQAHINKISKERNLLKIDNTLFLQLRSHPWRFLWNILRNKARSVHEIERSIRLAVLRETARNEENLSRHQAQG